jgi:hypothetical protein
MQTPPSSQLSPSSMMPFPQPAERVEVAVGVAVGVGVGVKVAPPGVIVGVTVGVRVLVGVKVLVAVGVNAGPHWLVSARQSPVQVVSPPLRPKVEHRTGWKENGSHSSTSRTSAGSGKSQRCPVVGGPALMKPSPQRLY